MRLMKMETPILQNGPFSTLMLSMKSKNGLICRQELKISAISGLGLLVRESWQVEEISPLDLRQAFNVWKFDPTRL